jgi:S1-C subfamily serine protease
MALAVLVSAGVAYAAVSALVSSGGGGSAGAGKAPVASSPVGTTAPAWLGVDTINAGGAMLEDVVPGGPADAAGLLPGDIITQIGNRPVRTPTDVESALAGLHPGQQVEIQYERGPISSTTQATLRAHPANGP